MIKCILSSVLLALLSFNYCIGQNIPIETWRTHFSYNSIRKIIPATNSVVCVATNGMFYINPSDKSFTLLGKNDGLSDTSPTALSYDKNTENLVVGFASGLVDIMQNGKVRTCRNIEQSPLIGSKHINSAVVIGDRVYVGNGFGVVSIDLESAEVIENFKSIGLQGADVPVFESISFEGQLVILTSQTIQIGSLNTNLLDFTNWKVLIASDSANAVFKSLTVQGDHIYAIANDTLIMKSDGGSFEIFQESTDFVHELIGTDQGLFGLTDQSIVKIDDTSLSTVVLLPANLNPQTFGYNNGFWVGTNAQGVYTPDNQHVLPNGPASDLINSIRFTDNQLFAFYGPHVDDYFDQVDSLGFGLFDNLSWKNIEIPGFYNLTDAATFSDHTYISSAGFGLYNYTTQNLVSGIEPSYQTDKIVIPELAVSQNLYIPCYEHHQPLYLMNQTGELIKYDSSYTITQSPTGVQVSAGETIWLNRSVFDNGGAICLNITSDEYRIITRSDGLPSTRVRDIALDKSDEAWIATAEGLTTFPDATYIFDDFGATAPIFNSENLFEDEEVTALAVDGGNRIWIGTADKGIWVFDNSFIQIEYRFQESNSSIPSNNVKDLAYNPKTGEMYILTDKGLASFRSNSSNSQFFHSGVNIFPNPVRPGYDGYVGIDGLATNSNLKITDVNGKLVRQLKANGGSASWDLLDYNNRKVLSGIYVIFSSSIDGEQTYIGKLAVVN